MRFLSLGHALTMHRTRLHTYTARHDTDGRLTLLEYTKAFEDFMGYAGADPSSIDAKQIAYTFGEFDGDGDGKVSCLFCNGMVRVRDAWPRLGKSARLAVRVRQPGDSRRAWPCLQVTQAEWMTAVKRNLEASADTAQAQTQALKDQTV